MATDTKRRAPNGRAKIRQAEVFFADTGDDRNWCTRMMMGTPTRGLVRIEWVFAMRSLVVPANWGNDWVPFPVDEAYPTRFTVAHAQNWLVEQFINNPKRYEWLFLLEDDVLPPPDLYIRFDEYLRDGPPVVSGLYYQKGYPPDPLIYRGRGNGSFRDWKPGQKVWADGIPTGVMMVHRSILELMYAESREYEYKIMQGGQPRTLMLHEVFVDPRVARLNKDGAVELGTGTSDLEFCRRIMAEDVFKRAGWPEIARRKYPFLVDTACLCGHVGPDGTVYGP